LLLALPVAFNACAIAVLVSRVDVAILRYSRRRTSDPDNDAWAMGCNIGR